jgi:pimeloyl-ACP methyl ester carboxylesterase
MVLVAAIVLPPLWFSLFPADPPPTLPAAGTRIVLSDGTGLNVLDSGQGTPVVLVHGLPGSGYDWRETADALNALGLRAIAYDRVGYGHSDARESGAYTPESNAAELVGLLDAMDLRDATVVGWSYGGATAMSASMGRPERIRRLVLVGTAGPDSEDAQPPDPSALIRFLYSDAVLEWRTAIPPLSVALMKALSNAAYNGGPQPDWWLDGLRANFSRWDTLITYREEMLGLTAESVQAFDPSRIEIPTLLLHGDEDGLAPVAIARYLATAIPNAKLLEYSGGSHMLPVTQAREIAEEIAAFTK